MQTKTFNIHNQKNQAVQDAYSMLTSNINLNSEQREIKTIVITSCKPDVGKTSLAINLAITMAGWGKKTLLVNTDMRKPVEIQQTNGDAFHGISDAEKIKRNHIIVHTAPATRHI